MVGWDGGWSLWNSIHRLLLFSRWSRKQGHQLRVWTVGSQMLEERGENRIIIQDTIHNVYLGPDVTSRLTGKAPDAGKDWGQEEKGPTEDEMVGWHHRLNGRGFQQALGNGDGQRNLACCNPWGRTRLSNRTTTKYGTRHNYLLDMQTLRPTPDLLNQNLNLLSSASWLTHTGAGSALMEINGRAAV